MLVKMGNTAIDNGSFGSNGTDSTLVEAPAEKDDDDDESVIQVHLKKAATVARQCEVAVVTVRNSQREEEMQESTGNSMAYSKYPDSPDLLI